ncbi:hypothetical protein [Streptomyces sp. NPDC050600]|uniref:hypothetical protein n=1 Tax=Streptomyces sp. NPDC050600 TaxID=3157213 RepID=UPI00342824A9
MAAFSQLIALAEDRAASGDAPSFDGARRDIRAAKTSLLSDVIPLNHDEAAHLAGQLCTHLNHALDAVALIVEGDTPPLSQALDRWEHQYDAIVECYARFSRVTGELVYSS